MENMRISYRILGGRPEGKEAIERTRRRLEDNINIVLRDRM
jgi:hypothetical protein